MKDYKDAKIVFGRTLRRLREKAGHTQEYLALCVGIAPTAISKFELGTNEPTLSRILQFAEALDVHPSVLLEGCSGVTENPRQGAK